MNIKIEEVKIGDYVKVKKGIKAPDYAYQLMDNWQGKVIDIQESEKLIEIEWDPETLLNTPEKYLKDLIKEGYDYEIMILEISDLERANRSANSTKIKDIKSKLEAKLHWIALFEDEGKSIKYAKLFEGIKLRDYKELYQKWEKYLVANLEFPIETEVVETERGKIQNGEKIKLLGIEGYDAIHGLFGIGKHERKTVTFPICNLEAINEKSVNYELLRDYAIWFANM